MIVMRRRLDKCVLLNQRVIIHFSRSPPRKRQMLDLWFSVVCTFLTFNVLFLVARLTSRVIEERVRLAYAQRETGVPLEPMIVDEKDPTTEVPAPPPPTLRTLTALYLTHLERKDAILGETEQALLGVYQRRVWQTLRVRASNDALPVWAETVASIYNNPLAFHLLFVSLCLMTLLLLYPIFAFFHVTPPLTTLSSSSPVVIPVESFPDQAPLTQHNTSETRRLAIVQLSGDEELRACAGSGAKWHPRSVCYVEEEETAVAAAFTDTVAAGSPPQWLSHTTLHQARRITPAASVTPHLLVDRHVAAYFVTTSIEPREGGKAARRLVSYAGLINELERLRVEDERRGHQANRPCICPVFLGLVTNTTLLYREDGNNWLVMHQPVIARNNSFASQLVSTMRHHFNSVLFPLSQRVGQVFGAARLSDLVHYDTIVVEYSVAAPEDATLVQLGELDGRLRRLSQRPVLLAQVDQFNRVQQQLTGNDAICFVYCDRVNSLVLSATIAEE